MFLVSAELLALLATLSSLVIAVPPRYDYGPIRERYDMPLTWTPFGFTSSITLGTPPQKLTTFVDWTWNSLYVVSTTCLNIENNKERCLVPEQQYFNQSKSKTFMDLAKQHPTQTWNPNHFFFNLNLTVDYSQDVENVGPVSALVRFQIADFQFKQQSVYPFGGVYGLSPVFKEQKNSAQSTFWQSWKQGNWPSPFIAFHYCYGKGSKDPKKKTCNGKDGIQTIGGYDHSRLKGEIEWHPIINFTAVNTEDFLYHPGFYDYWTIPLTSLSLGNEAQTLDKTTGAAAVFDHASYGRGAPLSDNAYLNLIKKVNATKIAMASPPNNGDQDTYQFDCKKTSSLPPIRYKFGRSNKSWEIVPKNYIVDYHNGTCVLNVRTLGTGDFIIGNFGETFSKDKYILMDFERLLVGIADLKW